jgi:hypothetical protein
MAFAKLNTLLRAAAALTISDLWQAIAAAGRARKGHTPCQTMKVSGSGSSYPHHHVLVRPSSRPRRGRRAGCKGCTSRGDSGRVESSP